MIESSLSASRRSAVAIILAAAGAAPSVAKAVRATPSAMVEVGSNAHKHDWDFLIGRWSVRHRRLKEWFVGSSEWVEFAGTCVDWATPDRQTNIDDNVVEAPSGTYRGITIRTYDVAANLWSLWWIDSRYATSATDPSVQGRFKGGVGEFFGDGIEQGRSIKWRTRWAPITPISVHWEQATSSDGGATWETNWTMAFARTAG